MPHTGSVPRGQYSHSSVLRTGTHTGFLLQVLQGPRGRDEEVSEAAQPIAPVEPLSHAEHLPEHRGRRGLKWWVEVRECVLDVGVEGFQILKRRRGSRVIFVQWGRYR